MKLYSCRVVTTSGTFNFERKAETIGAIRRRLEFEFRGVKNGGRAQFQTIEIEVIS